MKTEQEIKKKGLLIAFEGMDCSFKETNSTLLQKFLTKNKITCSLFSFPMYNNNSSFFIKNYLNGVYGDIDNIDPVIASTFYLLDFYHHWTTDIKPKYDAGEIIIFDRYIDSNVIYQSAKFNTDKDREWMRELLYNSFKLYKIPKPNITVCIDMSLNTTLELLEKKKGKDKHETNVYYLTKVYESLNEIKNKNKYICVDPIDQEGFIYGKDKLFYKIMVELNKKTSFKNRTKGLDINKLKGGKK